MSHEYSSCLTTSPAMRVVLPVTFFLLLTFGSVPCVCAMEKTFRIRGHSMEPALLPGDQVVVEENYFRHTSPKQDDLVAVSMKNRQTFMVKRVIATSGDTISFYGETLRVNKKAIRPINLEKWRSSIKQIKFYGGIIPPRTLLLLGDNARNSRDSRRLGLISLDQIAGKVVRIIKKAQ